MTHRFATSVEPGGTVRPAQPDAAPDAPAVASRLWAGLKGVWGLDAYDRYLRHHRRHHPDAPVLSEGEFWRCRWDDDTNNPKARCC